MDCNEVNHRLYEYIDRELSPEEVLEVEEHMQHCPQCFKLVRFESGVIKLVRKDCGCEKAPETLLQKIAAALRS